MAIKTSGSPVSRSERRTRTELLLESIALRHQIAVLERSRTSRPCFRCIDRLLWILLSFWWPQWRESLIIVRPEIVLRWCRNGWSAIWRYRSHGCWRGGRPKVSSEVRRLIVRMAGENFLWGAPRGIKPPPLDCSPCIQPRSLACYPRPVLDPRSGTPNSGENSTPDNWESNRPLDSIWYGIRKPFCRSRSIR